MRGRWNVRQPPSPVHRALLDSPEIHFRAVWRRGEHREITRIISLTVINYRTKNHDAQVHR
jgi:hypothetical protein